MWPGKQTSLVQFVLRVFFNFQNIEKLSKLTKRLVKYFEIQRKKH